MKTTIHEAKGAAQPSGSGRLRIKIIDPGKGSSGTYPAETLAAAAESGVIARGTHMYVNHASPSESYERPEGDLRNLAGVLTENAHLDEDGALVAEARVYGHWAQPLKDMAEDIGVSIRGNAEFEESGGERTITRIASIESVDFVTRPGRGGKILQVLESARPTKGQAVEAMAGDVRDWLEKALGGERSLVDFDEDTVVWRDWGGDSPHFQAQQYELAGTRVTLTGEPRSVAREQVFHAVDDEADTPASDKRPVPPKTPAPSGDEPNQNRTPTKESEAPVANVQITEAEHTRLTEAEQKLREAEVHTEQLQAQLAEAQGRARRAEAEAIVSEAFGDIPAPKGRAHLIESAAQAEDFDAEAFRAEATEAAAEYAPAGAGVRGLGRASESGASSVSESDILAVRGITK